MSKKRSHDDMDDDGFVPRNRRPALSLEMHASSRRSIVVCDNEYESRVLNNNGVYQRASDEDFLPLGVPVHVWDVPTKMPLACPTIQPAVLPTFPLFGFLPIEILDLILQVDIVISDTVHRHNLLLTGDRRMRPLQRPFHGIKKVIHRFPTTSDPSLRDALPEDRSISPDVNQNGSLISHLTSNHGAWYSDLTHIVLTIPPLGFYLGSGQLYEALLDVVYHNRSTLQVIDISAPLRNLFVPPPFLSLTPDIVGLMMNQYSHLETLCMACLHSPERDKKSRRDPLLILPSTVKHLKFYQVGRHRDFDYLILPLVDNNPNVQTLELEMEQPLNNIYYTWPDRSSKRGGLGHLILHLSHRSLVSHRKPEGPTTRVLQYHDNVVFYKRGILKGQVKSNKPVARFEEVPIHPAGPVEFYTLKAVEERFIRSCATSLCCPRVTWCGPADDEMPANRGSTSQRLSVLNRHIPMYK